MDVLLESQDALANELLRIAKRKNLVGKQFCRFKDGNLAPYMNYDNINSILQESTALTLGALENFKLRTNNQPLDKRYPQIKDTTKFDNFGMLFGYLDKAFRNNVSKYYNTVKDKNVNSLLIE